MSKLRLKPKYKKRLTIALISLVSVVVVGYLALCFVAGTNDFVSNTTINGIEVGNMTKQEAADTLSAKLEEDTKDLVLNMKVNDQSFQIDLKDNIAFDVNKIVDEVSKTVEGSFFTRGYYYLVHKDFNAPITIKDENALKESIQKSEILKYDTTVKTTYEIGEDKVTFTKGKDGVKVTEESILRQIKEVLQNNQFKEVIQCELIDNRLEDGEMEELHKQLNQEAKNATLDKKNDYALVDSQVGVNYSLEEAKKAFSKASPGETFDVPAKITQPKISKEDLEKNLFKDTLGSYSTYVSGSSVRKNNVKLAGLKCNSILLPGEEFSFNGTVGQRTIANGFGAAGAYRDGETVSEVGGGVCQASSTLYNAVLLSNLEVTLRYNHSFVSSYVPIGRDATVSWGGPDFKFKNNKDYPIKIVMSYSGGRLHCKILGTNVDGSYVKITSQRLSSTPFTTIYQDDPTLEVGKTKTKTSGYNGAKAQSYRYVYDKNGKLISSNKEAYSVYKKRDKVVLRGTKPVETPTEDPTVPVVPQTPPADTPEA